METTGDDQNAGETGQHPLLAFVARVRSELAEFAQHPTWSLDSETTTRLRGTARWVARTTTITQGAAHAKVRVAHATTAHEQTRRALALGDIGDGLTRGTFAVPTAQASMLKKALLALAAPRAKRARDGAGTDDHTAPTPGSDRPTYQNRRVSESRLSKVHVVPNGDQDHDVVIDEYPRSSATSVQPLSAARRLATMVPRTPTTTTVTSTMKVAAGVLTGSASHRSRNAPPDGAALQAPLALGLEHVGGSVSFPDMGRSSTYHQSTARRADAATTPKHSAVSP